MTGRHLDVAVFEVHAARNAMRDALLALYDAVHSGEPVDARFRRLMHNEIVGTREEAAVLAAVLAGMSRRDPVPSGGAGQRQAELLGADPDRVHRAVGIPVEEAGA